MIGSLFAHYYGNIDVRDHQQLEQERKSLALLKSSLSTNAGEILVTFRWGLIYHGEEIVLQLMSLLS